MKVFLRPPAHLSLAMFRVAGALGDTLPRGWVAVPTEDEADIVVLHAIGVDAVNHRLDKSVVVMQYGGSDLHPTWHFSDWQPLWSRALAVWSYYDLTNMMPPGARFYHAPLGVAEVFTDPFEERVRDIGCLTSGYVHGPGAEAILEPTSASIAAGFNSMHLGPQPVGIDVPIAVTNLIPDNTLAHLYRRSRYVSGLRHVEGFELPALEGLCCGARPIMFDRPNDRRWFGDHAVFVPECSGDELYNMLRRIIAEPPAPVSPSERAAVFAKFSWDTLGKNFWQMVEDGL
jgi:hypothetical protein